MIGVARCLDTALLAAREGLSTVPPKEDGTKTPLESWKKYQTTPADETQIRKWYQNGRQGVGLVCGEVSGGLEMFEFEGRAVRDGIQDRFKEIAEEAGLGDVLTRIRNGYVEQTPSGGIHVLWRCAEVDGNLKLARRVTDDGDIQVLIETRGEGGFTIIAPSSGPVHETGEPYVIVRGGLGTIPTITPEERHDLLNIARSLDEIPEDPKDSYNWDQATSGGGRPGDSYNDRTTGADVVALLKHHGWERVHQFGDRTQMRRPGKSIGISATVFDSGAFVCFTTSTRFDGYDQNTKTGVYSPFSVYAILEHGGNYSAAARALSPASTVILPGEDQLASAIPDQVWEARPELAHIRQAAWNRGRSADTVLAAVLARLAADTPHTIRLPAIVGAPCGLTIITALVGPPGTGKSSGSNIATSLIPAQVLNPRCDGVPPGSGEGLIELLYDWVKEPDPDTGKPVKVHRQTTHNAYMYVDEGEVLGKLASRQSGSTLLPALRTAFTSGVLGQANASQDRKRVIPAGQAVYGVVLGIQPELAGPLFDAAGAGTPQRILWASTTTPTPAPDDRPVWPGPLPRPGIPPTLWRDHERSGIGYTFHELGIPEPIAIEVALRDHHRQQHGVVHPLDEHQDLIQLKVAAVLAILDGRLTLNAEDWALAQQIGDTSRQVRNQVAEHLRNVAADAEAATSSRLARRHVEAAAKTTEWQTVETARTIARKVKADPGQLTRGKLRSAISPTQRDVFDAAYDHALTQQWIVARDEPGRGTGKQRLHPGEGKLP